MIIVNKSFAARSPLVIQTMIQKLLLSILILAAVLAQEQAQPQLDAPQTQNPPQPQQPQQPNQDQLHQQPAQSNAPQQNNTTVANAQPSGQVANQNAEATEVQPQAGLSQQSSQAQPSQTPQPQAAQAQAINEDKQNQNPQQAAQNHLENLTEEQKAKLLHEESIRVQLHTNEQLKLSDLVNITAEQSQSLEQKLKIQARKAYEKAKKEQNEIILKQKQELKQLLRSDQLSFSQKISARERLKQDQYLSDQRYNGMHFSEFMFDMDPYAEEDFMLTIPSAQPLGFYITVYKNHDGVYLKSVEYDEQDRKTIKIYENHNSIVYESSFYFSDAAIFSGRGNSTYTFRFINSKQHALVMLKVTQPIEAAHIEQKVTIEDISSHSHRAKQLSTAFSTKFYSLDTSLILQATNRKKLSIQIQIYSIYTLVELLIFVIMMLVQVKMLKGLLGSSSIV